MNVLPPSRRVLLLLLHACLLSHIISLAHFWRRFHIIERLYEILNVEI